MTDFRLLTRAEVVDGTRPPETDPETWAKYFAPPCMDRSAAGTRRRGGVGGAYRDAHRELAALLTYARMERRSASLTVSPLDAAAAVMAPHSSSSTRIERGLSPYRSDIERGDDLINLGHGGGPVDAAGAVIGGAGEHDHSQPLAVAEIADGNAARVLHQALPLLESSGTKAGGECVAERPHMGVDGVKLGLAEFGGVHVSSMHPVNTGVNTQGSPTINEGVPR